jgi:hypothetical protein
MLVLASHCWFLVVTHYQVRIRTCLLPGLHVRALYVMCQTACQQTTMRTNYSTLSVRDADLDALSER